MSSNNIYTPAGLTALQEEQKEVRRQICSGKIERLGNASTDVHNGDHQIEVCGELLQQDARYGRKFARLSERLLGARSHTPRQFDHVETGHMVTLQVDGAETRLVIGGPHEPSVYAGAQTISYESRVGKSLLGKEIGDVVMIAEVEMEIVGLVLPTELAAGNPASIAA
jgi:transcription elongation GreA/GreB family factor